VEVLGIEPHGFNVCIVSKPKQNQKYATQILEICMA
jgi:hypothetical protein